MSISIHLQSQQSGVVFESDFCSKDRIVSLDSWLSVVSNLYLLFSCHIISHRPEKWGGGTILASKSLRFLASISFTGNAAGMAYLRQSITDSDKIPFGDGWIIVYYWVKTLFSKT